MVKREVAYIIVQEDNPDEEFCIRNTRYTSA